MLHGHFDSLVFIYSNTFSTLKFPRVLSNVWTTNEGTNIFSIQILLSVLPHALQTIHTRFSTKNMLSHDSLQTPLSPSSPKLTPSTSFQILSACTGKQEKVRHRNDSSSTDSSSSRTVIRRTTSWRWIVVFGSFCVHFVADGLLFSFGILMHMIKDDLKLELHTVGIIASLFGSLPLLLAPLCSAMVNKIGCRFMTMLGGVLCSMGLFGASYFGNFTGALVGIGIACGRRWFDELIVSISYSYRCRSVMCLCSCSGYCCSLFWWKSCYCHSDCCRWNRFVSVNEIFFALIEFFFRSWKCHCLSVNLSFKWSLSRLERNNVILIRYSFHHCSIRCTFSSSWIYFSS